jgi:hypothetical protein
VPELAVVPIAHVGHWIWQLMYLAPLLVIAAALIASQTMERRNSGKYEREAEERAERELDDILSS